MQFLNPLLPRSYNCLKPEAMGTLGAQKDSSPDPALPNPSSQMPVHTPKHTKAEYSVRVSILILKCQAAGFKQYSMPA